MKTDDLIEPHVAALMGSEKTQRIAEELKRQRLMKYGCRKCAEEQKRFDAKKCGYCGLEFEAQ